MGAAALCPGLALDARSRRYPLVSDHDPVSAAKARRMGSGPGASPAGPRVPLRRTAAATDLSMNIFGISAGYHDAACCLMRGGRIVAAAQQERFSRTKNDKAFPRTAFRYCLDEAGLTIADIDCIAFYEDPSAKLGRQIWMGMLPGLTQQRRASILSKALWTRPEEEIRSVTGYEGPIEIVDHHLSHAASAYFFSGFEEAAVLTVDGVGEWATTTYNAAHGA